MIIKSITLNNYRLYEGVNKISFEHNTERNVHLICGENGFGKTMDALWAMYRQQDRSQVLDMLLF